MERGELRTLYVIGENPAQSEADVNRTRALLAELDFLVVQDIVMTRTAEMADVVLPAHRLVVRGRGHGDEQRAARAARAQGARPAGRGARRHVDPRASSPRRLGHDWGHPTAEEAWDELRSLSPDARAG